MTRPLLKTVTPFPAEPVSDVSTTTEFRVGMMKFNDLERAKASADRVRGQVCKVIIRTTAQVVYRAGVR